MTMKWVLRTLTVLIVLCLVGLGVALYRVAVTPSGETLALAPDEGGTDAVIGKFSVLPEPRPAPAVSFTAQSGKTVTLADFRGRVVLVNLWATWCVPCIKEMPSLARLQTRLGDLAILAISEDRRGAAAVAPFLAEHHIDGLAVYLDPDNAVERAFFVSGLPSSFLIDRGGRIVGSLVGAAQWDAPAMVQLINSYLRPTTKAASAE